MATIDKTIRIEPGCLFLVAQARVRLTSLENLVYSGISLSFISLETSTFLIVCLQRALLSLLLGAPD